MLASVWDLTKRAVLGASFGIATFVAIGVFLPMPPQPVEPDPVLLRPDGTWVGSEKKAEWSVPPGYMALAACVFLAVVGAFVAVVGKNWFGRKTKGAIIGMLIAGVLMACTAQRGGALEHGSYQLSVLRGCAFGAILGWLVAAFDRRRGNEGTPPAT
jgi:hypothetical protein